MIGTTENRIDGELRRVSVRPARQFTEVAPASVSVVIPCFNYAEFLTDAVESALSQAGVNVDVVIVDDASTDGSLQVAREFARNDPRVMVISHNSNHGPVATFNDGLDRVTGEFLVRLDADDLLTPGSLRRSVDLARAFPDVGLVYGRPVHFEGPPPSSSRSRAKHWLVWPGCSWLEARCKSGVNVITSPEVLMRSSVVHLVGGQRDLAHTHDMEMWFRIAAVSDIGYVSGPDQAWHREHQQSLSQHAASPVGITILQERRAAFLTLFDGQSVLIADSDRLRTQALETLAREALNRACYEFDRGRVSDDNTRALVDFAVETYSGAMGLREWRRLEHRLTWGERWLSRHPWNLGRPLLRIADDRARARRWSRTGVYERA